MLARRVDNGVSLDEMQEPIIPKNPRRSIYYHPVYNPYGVAPPGMPYIEQGCIIESNITFLYMFVDDVDEKSDYDDGFADDNEHDIIIAPERSSDADDSILFNHHFDHV